MPPPEDEVVGAMPGIRPPKPLVITSDNMANAWKLWLQQFDWYAVANKLSRQPPEVQVAVFMASIGADAIRIYNTFSLTTAQSKDLQVIKDKFAAKFSPTPNESYVRYQFFKLVQREGESFEDFLTTAETDIKDCGFGTLEDSLLRDKIVFGVNNENVRQCLLEEENLTLTKAIQTCKAIEEATKQLSSMKNGDSKQVDAVKRRESAADSSAFGRECGRCGGKHERNKCPAYGQTCKSCKKKGHFFAKCRSKNRTVGTRRTNYSKKKVNEIHHDEETNVHSVEDEYETLYVNEIRKNRQQQVQSDDWTENIKLMNNINVNMKLDTGAQCNVLPLTLAKETKAKILPSRTKRLVTFSNDVIPVYGEVELQCTVRRKNTPIKFVVVNRTVRPILGKHACASLNLIKRVDLVETPPPPLTDDEIKINIFRGLGCAKNFEYDIELEENAEFKIHPPRKIPHAIKDQVKQELDRMVDLGVIEPITEPTPAVSPLVIVKRNGKLRPCIDPTDINRVVKRRHYPLKTFDEIAANVKGSKYFAKLDCERGFWQARVSNRTSKYLTVNTPWGRYCFKRVPFGLSSAPEVFQQMMQKILDGIPNVQCSVDDILIYAATIEAECCADSMKQALD